MNKFFKTLSVFALLFIFSSIASAVQTGLSGRDQQQFEDYSRHHDIDSSEAQTGPTAPSIEETGTARCLGFDADAESVFFKVEIPYEWNGSSDIDMNVMWHSENGDIVANGETVKWDFTYHSIEEGEAVDNGTIASATATFTGGASEIDKEWYDTSVTIPYNTGNQPLTVHDRVFLRMDRDVGGDSYSGKAIVCRWEFTYTADKLATH